MVCRSMLASDIGEMDRARFRLSLGVSLGLGNRDTGEKKCTHELLLSTFFFSFIFSMGPCTGQGWEVCFTALYHMDRSLVLLH